MDVRSRIARAGLCVAVLGFAASLASATAYTLKVMTVVAVIFTPVVLVYQSWTYWLFRKRIAVEHIPAATVPALTP